MAMETILISSQQSSSPPGSQSVFPETAAGFPYRWSRRMLGDNGHFLDEKAISEDCKGEHPPYPQKSPRCYRERLTARFLRLR
jgi:hypothetical protein